MKLATAIHRYQRGVLSRERAAELGWAESARLDPRLGREGVDVFILDEASLARELGMDPDPRGGGIGGVGAVASFNGMQGDAKNPS